MEIYETVFDGFGAVTDYFVTNVPKLTQIFWTVGESGGIGQPTIIGVLALCGVGVGLTLLIWNHVRAFFRFR